MSERTYKTMPRTQGNLLVWKVTEHNVRWKSLPFVKYKIVRKEQTLGVYDYFEGFVIDISLVNPLPMTRRSKWEIIVNSSGPKGTKAGGSRVHKYTTKKKALKRYRAIKKKFDNAKTIPALFKAIENARDA